MSTLPFAVRLSLWATRALTSSRPLDAAVEKAAPDIDDVDGVLETLQTWCDLGERVVLPALPRPGAIEGLPRNDGRLTIAAIDAGGCVYVPGVGSALVLSVADYGPDWDRGTRVSGTVFDCEPTPRHRLEMLTARDADRALRSAVAEATESLARIGSTWGGGMRDLADAALAGGTWGLPPGLDRATTEVITRAATVSTIVSLALDGPDPAPTATQAGERVAALRLLERAAELALQDAATVAALAL